MTPAADARPERGDPSDPAAGSRTRERILLGVAASALLVLAASSAWVGEDAFITFRTIENFVEGDGLRWNVDERVQTYTHPLWMLVNAAAYFVTREVPYTTATLGLLFFTASFVLVGRDRGARSPRHLAILFVLVLVSRSVIRYATSGFESSLSLLVLAAFAVLLFGGAAKRETAWGGLSLLAALGATNRLDHALIFAPALAFLCATERRDVRWGRLALGALPLVAWLGFAVVYYGFPYPNTAPAKVGGGLPRPDLLVEGVRYAADLARHDPGSAGILLLGLFATLGCGARFARDRADREAGRIAAFGVGAFAYALYVIWIGGGFLSGRFFVLPVFASILIVTYGGERAVRQLRQSPRLGAAAVAFAASLALGLALSAHAAAKLPIRGEIRERSAARLELGSDLRWRETDAARGFRRTGESLRLRSRIQGRQVAVLGVVGLAGLAAGRDVIIVDPVGITDPLLARMPVDPDSEWGIGHLHRPIPDGYLEARRSGSLDGMEPNLRAYYRRLRLIVSGPLFSWARLKTILAFNLGRYDALLRPREQS